MNLERLDIMVKIIFEVSEDFIKQNADIKLMLEKTREGGQQEAVRGLMDVLCYSAFQNCIKDGKSEFVVSTDKLDGKSMEMYNIMIGNICALAAFAEHDGKVRESGQKPEMDEKVD